MVNINTSGAKSGRDFSYGASPVQQLTFIELYQDVMSKMELLQFIKDETTFQIELNKIRKNIQKIINDHFSQSISQLKSVKQFEKIATTFESDLNTITKDLSIK